MIKHKLLPIAVSAVISGVYSGTTWATGPIDGEWYGQIDLSAESQDAEATGFDERVTPERYEVAEDDKAALMSNASRMGFKGKTELTKALKVIYKGEFEIYADDGLSGSTSDRNTIEQRNIYVGLETKYGTIYAGKHDTPFKLVQDKVDQFNDRTFGDINNIMTGEVRANNIINYTTPGWYGLQGSVSTILAEDETGFEYGKWNGDGTVTQTEEDDFLDSISSSITWTSKKKDIYLGAGFDKHVPTGLTFMKTGSNPMRIDPLAGAGATTTNVAPYSMIYNSGRSTSDIVDSIRLVGQWKATDELTLGGIWQTAQSSVDNYKSFELHSGLAGNDAVFATVNEYDAYMLSAAYKIPNSDWKVKGQFGRGTIDTNTKFVFDQTAGAAWQTNLQDAEVTINQVALGIDYALSKQTTLYGFAVDLEADVESDSLSAVTTDSTLDTEATTIGLGVVHKF